MRWIVLVAVMVWVLLIPVAFSTGGSLVIVNRSGWELQCQLLNTKGECQMIRNQLNIVVKLEDNYSILDSDLEFEGGPNTIEAYFDGCRNISEDAYICSFSIQPVVKVTEKRNVVYKTYGYFYLRSGVSEAETIRKDLGNLKIVPLTTSDILSVEGQEESLKNTLNSMRRFVYDTLLDSGMCIARGYKEIYVEGIDKYEEFLSEVGNLREGGLNFFGASGVLASLTTLIFKDFGMFTPSLGDELSEIFSRGYYFGFSGMVGIGENRPTKFFNFLRQTNKTCDELKYGYGKIFDVNIFTHKMSIFLRCLEKRTFFECVTDFENARNYLFERSSPKLSRLKIYAGVKPLENGIFLCRNVSIRIEYEHMDKIGGRNISTFGAGKYGYCMNTVVLEGSGYMEIYPDEFLCGVVNSPLNGAVYDVKIRGREEVTYRVTYYDDPANCIVEQELVPV